MTRRLYHCCGEVSRLNFTGREVGKSETKRACLHFGWPLFRQRGYTMIRKRQLVGSIRGSGE